MSRKKPDKEYWEMTPDELRKATKEFDREFVASKGKRLSQEMQDRWDRARAKLDRAKEGSSQETIAVSLDKALLDRCSALAKKKRLSWDALVTRGLRAVLAAEGEG